MVIAIACLSLVWGVLSTLVWLWIVLRVLAALERFSRAHAKLASAVERIAERQAVDVPHNSASSDIGAIEANWSAPPPGGRGEG
jgi:hypothetical protein